MSTTRQPPSITAHRGSSAAAPENTLAAFQLAIADGADLCELDVVQAGDGMIVVTHDTNLRRVSGVDLDVWDASAEQISALEAGSHFDETFRGEPVPSLDQVLEAVKGRLGLNLELKAHGRERGFAEAVIEAIQRHGVAEACVVTSLDADLLRQVRGMSPGLRLGLILTATSVVAPPVDVDLYSVEQEVATLAFIQHAHQEGREVHVWTVNTRADMERFIARGADSLITSHPRIAREVLAVQLPTDEMRSGE